MFGKSFWVNLFERAISTFAQAAVGVLSAGSLGLLHVNWTDVVSVAGLASLLSILKTFSVVAASPGEVVPADPSTQQVVDAAFAKAARKMSAGTVEATPVVGPSEPVQPIV